MPAPNAAPAAAPIAAAADPPPAIIKKPRLNKRPILYLTVNIINCNKIDTVNQCFSCEFVVRVRKRDSNSRLPVSLPLFPSSL